MKDMPPKPLDLSMDLKPAKAKATHMHQDHQEIRCRLDHLDRFCALLDCKVDLLAIALALSKGAGGADDARITAALSKLDVSVAAQKAAIKANTPPKV